MAQCNILFNLLTFVALVLSFYSRQYSQFIRVGTLIFLTHRFVLTHVTRFVHAQPFTSQHSQIRIYIYIYIIHYIYIYIYREREREREREIHIYIYIYVSGVSVSAGLCTLAREPPGYPLPLRRLGYPGVQTWSVTN